MLSSGYRTVIFIHGMVSGMRNAGMEKTFFRRKRVSSMPLYRQDGFPYPTDQTAVLS